MIAVSISAGTLWTVIGVVVTIAVAIGAGLYKLGDSIGRLDENMDSWQAWMSRTEARLEKLEASRSR